MRITTPSEVARQAGNKYLGVLVAAKFARYLNEFPKDQLAASGEKLTTQALESLQRLSLANGQGVADLCPVGSLAASRPGVGLCCVP